MAYKIAGVTVIDDTTGLQSTENIVSEGTEFTLGTDNVNREISISGGRGVIGYAGSEVYLEGGATKGIGLRVNGSSSSALSIDTGGKVGIGTATPSSILHVEGTTTGTGTEPDSIAYFKQNGTWDGNEPWALYVDGYSYLNGFRINAADGVRALYKTTAGGSLGFAVSGDDPITFTQSTSTERMRIDAGGNVGIGTSSPSFELDVQNTTDPSIRVRSTGTASTDDTFLRSQIGGTTASNYVLFGDTDNTLAGYIRYRHSDDNMIFATNNTAQVYIDSSGNVGIGTDNPNTSLHVNGDTTFGGAIDETVHVLSQSGTLALDPSNGTIQTVTPNNSIIFTDSLSNGESITLMINNTEGKTITWPTTTWVNNNGIAPTTSTTSYTVVALWKVGSTLYGALVGDGS